MRLHRIALAASIIVCSALVRAQSPLLPVATVVKRAAAYVERFHQDFGSVVAEERYEQTTRPVASATRTSGFLQSHTVLRSDFLLVKIDEHQWLPFRDVFERDGQAVRDRQDRLSKLFLGGATASALSQAQRIMNESARYNIGNGTRTINVPTLPLMFLSPDGLSRMSFSEGKGSSASAGHAIAFEEIGHPTVITTTEGRDLPASGRFWIDEESGAVVRAEVRADDTAVQSEVVVTFEWNDMLKVWVPARMEERFRARRDNFEVRGVATYANFRRFNVSTSESVQTPPPDSP